MFEPVPNCPPLVGSWLRAIEDTRDLTREVLDGISSDAVDWRDACSVHTIGTLLYHIAVIEADWLYAEVLERDFAPEIVSVLPYDVRDKQGNLTHVEGESLEAHWARLNAVRQALMNTFRSMSLEDFQRARILPEYEVTPEWVLHHLCQHEAEHRSELITLRAHFERRS